MTESEVIASKKCSICKVFLCGSRKWLACKYLGLRRPPIFGPTPSMSDTYKLRGPTRYADGTSIWGKDRDQPLTVFGATGPYDEQLTLPNHRLENWKSYLERMPSR